MATFPSSGSSGSSLRVDDNLFPTKDNYATNGDIWDPDTLVQCPLDESHKVRSKRYPYHYLKCLKNHPELAAELRTCPYNARHMVKRNQLTLHMSTCENRPSEDNGISHKPQKWQAQINNPVNPDQTEDWDTEVDESVPPFVWGLNTLVGKKPEEASKMGQNF